MRKGDIGHCTTGLEIADRTNRWRAKNLNSERLNNLPEDTQLDGGRTGFELNLFEIEPKCFHCFLQLWF